MGVGHVRGRHAAATGLLYTGIASRPSGEWASVPITIGIPKPFAILGPADTLTDSYVLSSFSLSVGKIFAGRADLLRTVF